MHIRCSTHSITFKTHTHTQTYTHTHTHKHTHTHARTRTRTRTHTRTHTNTHTISHTHAYTHAHTQGGFDNVVSMLQFIAATYPLPASPATPAAVVAPRISPPKETPALGCLHPAYKGGREYFEKPEEYMKWCVGGGGGVCVRACVCAYLLPFSWNRRINYTIQMWQGNANNVLHVRRVDQNRAYTMCMNTYSVISLS